MTPEELEKLIEGLKPSDRLYKAVSFLMLVSKNNPHKTAAELSMRPDVQQAKEVIDTWTDNIVDAVELAETTTSVPITIVTETEIEVPVKDAVDKFKEDTDMDKNHDEWSELDNDRREKKVASLVSRSSWIFEWVDKLIKWLLGPEKKWKRWHSRRLPNSCRVCVAMHGVTIPIEASFAPYLLERGGKPYGGTFTAHAHPRCRCSLRYLSDEELDDTEDDT